MDTERTLLRLRDEMAIVQRMPEAQLLPALIEATQTDTAAWNEITALATQLIDSERRAANRAPLTAMLRAYPLNSTEGLALLGLAECCLRVPDRHTLQLLIRDKLARGEWRAQRATPALVGALSLSLRMSQRLLNAAAVWPAFLQRASTAMLRRSCLAIMRQLGREFVFDRSIEAALRRANSAHLVCSFDMLGEAARTAADADRYFEAYRQAITAVANDARLRTDRVRHSVSVKLSALHPRYEMLQAVRVLPEVTQRLAALAQLAMTHDVELTIDAEECDRLDLSLDITEQLLKLPALRDWQGLNVAVQAYQKRAAHIISWLEALAAARRRQIGVRLVKGAYWDTEIKRCQERGLHDFPVYTRKAATDVSYLACARQLLASAHLRPAFATHNALTIATLLSWIGARRDVEFQRLHGMAAALYRSVAREHGFTCRVYAPVGPQSELLPYLIRRMLENGANSSFVQRLGDPGIAAQALVKNPIDIARETQCAPHPAIRPPAELFAPTRRNSIGLDLADRHTLHILSVQLGQPETTHSAYPMGAGLADTAGRPEIIVRNPSDLGQIIGHVRHASQEDVHAAIAATHASTLNWSSTPVEARCACLERMADLLEQQRAPLMRLLVHEAGKTRSDALSEVREGVDFCRYYAYEARRLLTQTTLPGPSGESNLLTLHPRGVFACISPWNFPLSIFLGQITAALVTGNCVIAKPAPQTPLIAALLAQLLREAGTPKEVFACLPGGPEVGEWIVADPRIAGIAFTGSTRTARRIAQRVVQDAHRPLTTLIAETGGINAMIVDSTALPEQVVRDVVVSAFQSAGQRCSALRLLCLQEEIYERMLSLLCGAMAELKVGNPNEQDTDVGPLIDTHAHQRIRDYLAQDVAGVVYQTPMADALPGWFVAPTLIALAEPQQLREEVFGPVLHVTRWRAGHLEELLHTINEAGYGLTLGLHSRLESAANLVRQQARVGNIYINRSMIGAVVGAQPFGGEGMSGTGPKAGGPNYLQRFCTERVTSIDTTAAGGNATLLSIDH